MQPQNLPPSSIFTLFELVSEIETASHYRRIRFEPLTYQNLLTKRTDSQKLIIQKISTIHACSWGTALMIYSTSFGIIQLMGFNMYGNTVNYGQPFWEFMTDPMAEFIAFNSLTKEMGLDKMTPETLAASPADRLKFATKYNGSADYANNIVNVLKRHQFSVKV